MQINTDLTLRHKIENINLLLTNQSLSSPILNNMPSSINNNISAEIQEFNQDNFNDSIEKKKAQVKLAASFESSPSSNSTIDACNNIGKNQNHANINYDKIEMLLIDLKKYIVNCVFHWNTKMSDFFKKNKYTDEEVSVSSAGKSESISTNPIEIPKIAKQISQPTNKEDDGYYGK